MESTIILLFLLVLIFFLGDCVLHGMSVYYTIKLEKLKKGLNSENKPKSIVIDVVVNSDIATGKIKDLQLVAKELYTSTLEQKFKDLQFEYDSLKKAYDCFIMEGK